MKIKKSFSNLQPGDIIKNNFSVTFHIQPDLLSLGRTFYPNTIFTVLELSEPQIGFYLAERNITVLVDNQKWFGEIDKIGFALKFEIIS